MKIIVSVVEIKLFAIVPIIALILLALMEIVKELALHYTKQIAHVELVTHFAIKMNSFAIILLPEFVSITS